jgi:hypothetical protein
VCRRYDGRGHLFDLSKYDADTQKGKYGELSEEEQAVEAACDEERYLELHSDVQEKTMYEGNDNIFSCGEIHTVASREARSTNSLSCLFLLSYTACHRPNSFLFRYRKVSPK